MKYRIMQVLPSVNAIIPNFYKNFFLLSSFYVLIEFQFSRPEKMNYIGDFIFLLFSKESIKIKILV